MPTKPNKLKFVFEQYKIYIAEKIHAKYAPSYATIADIKDKWRHNFAYNKELEDFLIFETKVFIRLLDWQEPNFRNPDFLKSLVKSISSYLAAYVEKSSKYGNDHMATLNYLNDVLFNSFYYIQALKNNKDAKSQSVAPQKSKKSNNITKRKSIREDAPQNRTTKKRHMNYAARTRQIVRQRIMDANQDIR